MEKCLICNKELETKFKLTLHIKTHGLTKFQYKDKFNLHKRCNVCGSILFEGNITGTCKKHRDISGSKNPFYHKEHSQKTKDILKVKTSINSKNFWKNEDYRNKVISSNIGKTRSETFKKEQSERITQWYRDNENQKAIRSKHMKNIKNVISHIIIYKQKKSGKGMLIV